MLKPIFILVSAGLASAAVLALAGCGQTGALYLPDRPAKTSAPTKAPASPERLAAHSTP